MFLNAAGDVKCLWTGRVGGLVHGRGGDELGNEAESLSAEESSGTGLLKDQFSLRGCTGGFCHVVLL